MNKKNASKKVLSLFVSAGLLLVGGCAQKQSRVVPLIGTDNKPVTVVGKDGTPKTLITGFNDENEDIQEPQTGAIYAKATPEDNLGEANVHTIYVEDSTLKQGAQILGGVGSALTGVGDLEHARKYNGEVGDDIDLSAEATGGAGGAGGSSSSSSISAAESESKSESNVDDHSKTNIKQKSNNWNQPQNFIEIKGGNKGCHQGHCSITPKAIRPYDLKKANFKPGELTA